MRTVPVDSLTVMAMLLVFVVDIYVGAVDDLRGYQLAVAIQGGKDGTLDVKDLYIDTSRADFVFAGLESFPAIDVANARMMVALMQDGIRTSGQSYLGTCVLRGSSDARGAYEVTARLSEGTYFLDSSGQPMDVRLASKAAISLP